MHFVKGEQMTRCVSVGSCNESKAPIENMSPMFPWEIERVAAEFEASSAPLIMRDSGNPWQV